MILLAAVANGATLCEVLTRGSPTPAAVGTALGAGGGPNVGCEVKRSWYEVSAPSLAKVLLGALVPPVGIAMALSADPRAVEARVVVLPIALALASRDLAVVELLLAGGADPNAVDSDRRTALYHAAAADLAGAGTVFVTRLAAAGGRVGGAPEAGWLASVFDRPELFRILLANGLAIDTADATGETLLSRAVEAGDVPRVERILVHRPDIDRLDRFRMAPLHVAVDRHRVGMTRVLLQNGAAVDLPRDGRTPLAMAVIAGHHDTAALLLEFGADLRVRGASGGTLLHEVVERGLPPGFLLDRGLEIDAVDTAGRSALDVAIARRSLDLAAALLARGAKPDRALAAAIATGDRPGFERLVGFAGPEALTRALAEALARRQFAMADALVARGALPRGDIVAHATRGEREAVGWLLAHGAVFPADCLPTLVRDGSAEAVVLALDHGALPRGAGGEAALALAFAEKNLGVATLLLQRGADPDRGDLLAVSIERGDTGAVELLASSAARIGSRHLGAAIRGGDVAIFNVLAVRENTLPASSYLWGMRLSAMFSPNGSRELTAAVRAAGLARRR